MLTAKPQATRQQGFAMLEVMLAVLIIAIASFGIYKLYNSASDTSRVNNVENVVSQIESAVNQYASNADTPPTATQLYNIAPDIFESDKTTIRSYYPVKFTAVTAAGQPPNAFQLDISNLTPPVAMSLAKAMLAVADVSINTNLTNTPAAISDAGVNEGTTNTVTLEFPRTGKSK